LIDVAFLTENKFWATSSNLATILFNQLHTHLNVVSYTVY